MDPVPPQPFSDPAAIPQNELLRNRAALVAELTATLFVVYYLVL